MLNTFLRPQMKRQRLYNMQNVYFQQDGATPHTARLSMDVVRRMFPGRFAHHWYSLLLLGYKHVQHVTVLNTVGNCSLRHT
jgi:hypothetical protein